MNFKILKDYRFKLLLILIVTVISFLIWGIYELANKLREDSFFTTGTDIDPAHAKLVVVDQYTGRISFIDKSLANINALFTDENEIIVNALKRLFGENLKGEGIPSEFLESGDGGILKKIADATDLPISRQPDICADGSEASGASGTSGNDICISDSMGLWQCYSSQEYQDRFGGGGPPGAG